MDDEARIRIALIIALGAVLIVCVPFIVVAWHGNVADHDSNGPELATISLCRSLPADQREGCLARLDESDVVKACTSSELTTNNDDPKAVPDSQGQAEINACIVAAGGKQK